VASELSSSEPPEVRTGRWERGAGVEFDRVAAFNDAVFAIALTLLVLELHLPEIEDAGSVSQFVDALGEILPTIASYALAFVWIGFYWVAQHSFFARLRAVDGTYLALNVVYLALVALLPFPAGLLGEYDTNPMSIVLFAVVLAGVSLVETLLLIHARRAKLQRWDASPAEHAYALRASLAPVLIFIVTIPLAFLIGPIPTLITWVPLNIALQWLLARHAAGTTSG
jgi:TMEM175 potassium channel family protein